jgi:hypothetical protein
VCVCPRLNADCYSSEGWMDGWNWSEPVSQSDVVCIYVYVRGHQSQHYPTLSEHSVIH